MITKIRRLEIRIKRLNKDFMNGEENFLVYQKCQSELKGRVEQKAEDDTKIRKLYKEIRDLKSKQGED